MGWTEDGSVFNNDDDNNILSIYPALRFAGAVLGLNIVQAIVALTDGRAGRQSVDSYN